MNKIPKNKFFWMPVILGFIILFSFYSFLKNKPVEIKIAPVVNKTIVASISEEGTVRAEKEATLAFKSAGRVAAILEEGQAVFPGQAVGALDNQEARAQVNQAQASRAEARANFQRDTDLRRQGIISNQQFQDSGTRARIAEEQYKAAAAQADGGRLIAPFAGVVSRKYVSVGELATPGVPAAAVIDDRQVYVELQIDENDISRVKSGEAVVLTSDAFPDSVFNGKIDFVNPQAELKKIGGVVRPDEKDKIFRAKVSIDSPRDKNLRPGMTVYVDIPTQTKQNVLVVPREAVFNKDGKTFLFVAKGRRVRQTPVTVGLKSVSEVEITRGVKSGDKVATINLEKLKSRSRIKIIKTPGNS